MKHTLKKSSGAALLAGISLLGFRALGQDVDSVNTGGQPSATGGAQGNPLPTFIGAGASYQFKTDINGGGQFGLTRARVDVGQPLRLTDSTLLLTRFRYEIDNYDFTGGPAPWQNINTISADSLLKWKANDAWSIYGGPMLKISAESGAKFGDGFTGGGLAGVNYKYSDTLMLGGGLAVSSQLEDNALATPLITADWKFADQWQLKVGFLDLSTIGYAASVAWVPNQKWELGFGAQYHRSRFRIEGNGVSSNGVGQEESAILFTSATCHLARTVDLVGFVGLATGGNLQLDNSSGNQLNDHNYDPAPVIGIRLDVRL